MKVLRVALDVPVAKLFDYLDVDAAPAEPGDRVLVPFGTRERVGVVVESGDGSNIQPRRALEHADRALQPPGLNIAAVP